MPYLIDYEIRQSQIVPTGIGLFTKVKIARGDKISRLDSRERIYYDLEQIEIIEKSYDHKARIPDLLTYGWYNDTTKKYIYAIDDDRFVNHSSDPNMEEMIYDGQLYQIALRDIEIGEELTNDYATFECLPDYILYLYDKYHIWHF